MDCTTSDCPREAAKIIAWPMLSGRAVFVAPYCHEHAADIEVDMGGVVACGPALADAAREIEGVR